MESSEVSVFEDILAHTHTIEDQESWFFNHQPHGMYFDSFLLPANAPLIINVWTRFEADFHFNDNDSDSFGDFDFYENPGIACPGVVLIATPVTLF